jgi:hypothetical protein
MHELLKQLLPLVHVAPVLPRHLNAFPTFLQVSLEQHVTPILLQAVLRGVHVLATGAGVGGRTGARVGGRTGAGVGGGTGDEVGVETGQAVVPSMTYPPVVKAKVFALENKHWDEVVLKLGPPIWVGFEL